jgi:hypothetical protein
MGASTRKRASPNWHARYEAAVLEMDLNKLPQRSTEARPESRPSATTSIS